MASRMERYNQNKERSSKNEGLYNQLQEVGPYSNIEGVVSIDTTNEIDVTKVKAMMQNRENYLKQKKYSDLIDEEPISEVDEPEADENTGSYDLREVLDKAKEDREEPDNENRKLKPIQYDILEKLKLRATPEEEKELQELIHTLSVQNLVIEKGLTEQEAGDLLDDLKSDTMVGDPTSIRKIIEEVKEEEEEKEVAVEIDKSFYTTSLDFSDKDFEDLRGHDSDKEGNLLKKVAMIAIPVLILIIVIILIVFM